MPQLRGQGLRPGHRDPGKRGPWGVCGPGEQGSKVGSKPLSLEHWETSWEKWHQRTELFFNRRCIF